jgi:hypothetical protein
MTDLPGRPAPAQGPESNMVGILGGQVGARCAEVETAGFNGKAWLDLAGHP